MNTCIICSSPTNPEIEGLQLASGGWICSFVCFCKALDFLPEQTKFEQSLVDTLKGLN